MEQRSKLDGLLSPQVASTEVSCQDGPGRMSGGSKLARRQNMGSQIVLRHLLIETQHGRDGSEKYLTSVAL